MKRLQRMLPLIGVMALMMASMTPGLAEKAGTKEVVWPAAQIHYKEAIPGVTKATLWGDPAKGPYATLTKFAKGTKNALHTHAHDIKIVVISGTLIEDFGDGEKKLGPGSYVFEPAGMKHTNGSGGDGECLFFEESDGPFDIQWVK